MIELTVTQSRPPTEDEIKAREASRRFYHNNDYTDDRLQVVDQLLRVSLTEVEWQAVKRGVLEAMK